MPRAKKQPEKIIEKEIIIQGPNPWIMIISIVLTAVVVGGIVFFGQQRIVSKNKKDLEESQKSVQNLKAQIDQLQSIVNQSAANQNQIEGNKYFNEDYKFTLIIPKTWEKYSTKNTNLDLGTVGKFESVDFYFEDDKPIFTISMIDKNSWDEAQALENYKPVKLNEDQNFIYAFSFHKDSDEIQRESLRPDMEKIVSTFKFEDLYQAQIQIEKCSGEYSIINGTTNINLVTLGGINFVASVKGCYLENPDVLYSDSKNVYYAFKPSGVGGYILYGKYASFYKLDLETRESTMLSKESNGSIVITDIDVSKDGAFAVYKSSSVEVGKSNNEFIIRNLNTGKEGKYKLPVSGDNMQFGDFKFSPNSDKLAIAIGYGPEKESGAVYLFDLTTKKFSSYQTFDTSIPHIDSWIDNEKLNLK